MLRLLRPGSLTTVQDLGRPGWQHAGVPVGGAMDPVALRVANWLVGNDAGAAALECTLAGPTLEALDDTYLAVTGADMNARVGDRRIPPWRSFRLAAGDTLILGSALNGCRTYIAVAGGIDVPPVLGSRSTYARAGIGGLEGRALRAGDIIPSRPGADPRHNRGVRLGSDLCQTRVRPAPDRTPTPFRLIPAPHLAGLTPASRRALFGTPFIMAPDSDRMGIRFAGPRLELAAPAEPLSAGVAMGTMQLPPAGAPIILMADRQTTGGYPRLGEVATVDHSCLAQLRPGEQVRFEEISLAEAERLYLVRERELDRIRRFLFMPS